MKKALIAGLMILAGIANAGEYWTKWQSYGKAVNGTEFFIAPASVYEVSPKVFKVSTKTDAPDASDFVKIEIIDCNTKESAIAGLYSRTYDRTIKFTEQAKFVKLPATSIGASLVELVCNK